jgi:hypothetical protein
MRKLVQRIRESLKKRELEKPQPSGGLRHYYEVELPRKARALAAGIQRGDYDIKELDQLG